MIGIDIPIERLRADFENYLWVGAVNSFNGRCFRNQRDGKLIPEIKGDRDEYREVLLQDGNDSTVFFDVDPDREMKSKSQSEANVSIYFAVNLEELYPSLSRNEASETAYVDAVDLINGSGFDVTGIISGKEAFNTWGYEDSIFDDMHPYHLFRIDSSIVYNLRCG